METKYISIGKASRLFPGEPSPATLWRWYQRGVRGVKLQTWMIGGRRYTTASAVDSFIAATTAAADRPAHSEDASPRSEAATRQLQAAGVI